MSHQKSKSVIPSYIVFGLLLGLVQCSETAMRSALYEPDLGNDTPIGPTKASPEKTQSTTTTARRSVDRTIHGSQKPVDETEGSPSTSAKTSTSQAYGSLSEMELTLTDKENFVGTLWPEASSSKIEIESIRMDLRTTEVLDELSERHLEGYLIVKALGLKTRQLSNQGPVIFAAAGATDIMQAEFRITTELKLVVDMTRARSRTPEEADQNLWEGTVTLLKGERRMKVGTLKGLVTLRETD
jgi:hypothetical protein